LFREQMPPSIWYIEMPLACVLKMTLLRIIELWTPSMLMPEPPPTPLL
jgi:hypothetical protein